MRTRVVPDPKLDAREVELSLQNPHRHDDLLVFPRTKFEIYKWTRTEFIGFALSVMGVGLVLLFIWLLVSLGA
jgi:hypothetical protein